MPPASANGPIIIAGGSGFLGVSLATHLANAGKSVAILSRNAPKAVGPCRHIRWDARTPGDWRGQLNGAAGLVNLVGRTVDCIKTLRRAMGIQIDLPAFAWMVGIGAPLLLRTDPELAIYGRYLVSQRLKDEGFKFRFPNLGDALADLLRR